MDLLETHKKERMQYFKEHPEEKMTFAGDIKAKYFNSLEPGELPEVAKMFLSVLNMLYDDDVLTRKPAEVSACVNDSFQEPRFEIRLVLS